MLTLKDDRLGGEEVEDSVALLPVLQSELVAGVQGGQQLGARLAGPGADSLVGPGLTEGAPPGAAQHPVVAGRRSATHDVQGSLKTAGLVLR